MLAVLVRVAGPEEFPMSLVAWMNEMVGRTVLVETDDDEFTGELEAITEEPMLALRLKSVVTYDDDEFGTTLIAWKPGHRISLVEDDEDDEDD